MTALGKLVRSTAFRLTLVYLLIFVLYAAALLAYFALNTGRLITEQITATVETEIAVLTEQYTVGGLRRLVLILENRSLRPGSSLYLVTAPTGQAVAGNVGPAEETSYRVGDLELDRLSHRVARGKDELTLQPREFRLLEYLMKHAGQVVTRTMLLENVWDYHFDPQTNVIDVHISRLRSKIDKGFERPLLHTIRGAGYMIRDGLR